MYVFIGLMNIGKSEVMSEVPKKKKKKRHHSGSSSDIEVASKRIKVEISDTEHNDSLANSSQANDQLCYPELRYAYTKLNVVCTLE